MYIGNLLADPRHRTLCWIDGQLCRVFADHGDGTVRVEWLADHDGADRDRALASGLVQENPNVLGVTVPADRVEAPFVHADELPGPVWTAFPAPAAFGEPSAPAVAPDAVAGLTAALRDAMPEGWQEVLLDCQALGRRLEVHVNVTTADGELPFLPPADVVEWLRRARVTAYEPGRGAWTTARLRLAVSGEAGVDLGYEEPDWAYLRTREDDRFREYYEELRFLPRDRDVPAWLLEPALDFHRTQVELNRAHPERLRLLEIEGGLKVAEPFDATGPDGRPVAYRPALPSAEKAQVLDYLTAGHTFLSSYGTGPDVLDPERPAGVPEAWLTDGVWVWPGSMAYYLEHHDITPPLRFLDHMRGHGHHVPEVVADDVLDRARALVMGTNAQDQAASEVIEMVLGVVAGLRISRNHYSFHSPIEDGWTMMLDADGWWSVFCTVDQQRKNEARFPTAMDAAAHMIGCLTLSQERIRRDPDDVLDDYECTIQPLPVDPPLSAYDKKRHVVLNPGRELDRYGGPDGNTLFDLGTPPNWRAQPEDLDTAPMHRYRVQAAFQALEGEAKPANGRDGGGLAYILPQSIDEMLANGWLVEFTGQRSQRAESAAGTS
ncbi:TNT domain-containing protein [Amycolatopsis sp. NPDC006131]|uniref:TNT domain-containing protein n=1 Tax=Amycolatopsis sp. NPDC006131 TaxID=3156731 RepID=UPI00339EE497